MRPGVLTKAAAAATVVSTTTTTIRATNAPTFVWFELMLI